MAYNPDEYWKTRGKTYKTDFDSRSGSLVHRAKYGTQERLLFELLGRLSFKSVLEIGCGFGRVTKLMVGKFPTIESYDALDLSPDQLKSAEAYVNSSKVKYHCTPFQAFPGMEKSYDLVLASEVLLHVTPDEIKGFLARMVALSKMHVVHIDWSPKSPPKSFAPHNFPHDYLGLYKELGGKIRGLEVIRVKGRVLAIFPMDFGQAIYHASV